MPAPMLTPTQGVYASNRSFRWFLADNLIPDTRLSSRLRLRAHTIATIRLLLTRFSAMTELMILLFVLATKLDRHPKPIAFCTIPAPDTLIIVRDTTVLPKSISPRDLLSIGTTFRP